MNTEILTAKEVAERLRISLRHAYRLFTSGELPGYRVNSTVRFYASGLEEFRQRNANKKAPVVPPLLPNKTEVRKQGRGARKPTAEDFTHLRHFKNLN